MSKKISCVQMASGINLQGNLQEAKRLIHLAVKDGAELVVLPEDFAFMGNAPTDKLKYAEDLGEGPIQTFISKLAAEHKVWIVAGTIPIKTEDANLCSTAVLVFNEKGEQVHRYNKIHLFDVTVPDSTEEYKESDVVKPGDELCVFDSPFGKIGISVCYDLRFPELYRAMIDQGMEVLIVPSAFTYLTGKAHWQPLVLTRAIENQCFVVAANQGGYHANGRQTFGHSMIVSPWGAVLSGLEGGAGIVTAEIDLQRIASLRKTFPALEHRVKI